MDLVFWQNILSPHQVPYIRALASRLHQVTIVTPEILTAERAGLGWEAPGLGDARLVLAPDRDEVDRLVIDSPRHCVHIWGGSRSTYLGNRALRLCISRRRRVGIVTESPDPRGIGGLMRWIKYARERLVVGGNFDFVMAMGEIGIRWFRACGYSSEKLFPFCYVTEIEPSQGVGNLGQNVFTIVFAGRLVTLKGTDVLLEALRSFPNRHWRLKVIGEGPEQESLRMLASRHAISDRVEWLGSLPPSKVHAEMAQADLFVLPSRKDGWGAVVNEAIMAGTPVVCSDACGASDLIRHPWLGTVFESENVESLCGALATWITRGRSASTERARIAAWSRRINGGSVARYFEQVLRHVYEGNRRPEAPWY